MRRIQLFLFALVVTLAVLLTLAAVSWYYSVSNPNYYGDSWMSQMWGSHLGASGNYGGMGGMMGGGTSASASYLWVIPLILGIVVAAAIVGVAFYSAFPELKYIKGNATCNTTPAITEAKAQTVGSVAEAQTSQTITANPSVSSNCDVLLRTLTPEEKKVLNVLVAHQGKYLQKYVVKETGLSRLKTHRIIARFAERGIVSVKEFGNTNEVVVSDWVKT